MPGIRRDRSAGSPPLRPVAQAQGLLTLFYAVAIASDAEFKQIYAKPAYVRRVAHKSILKDGMTSDIVNGPAVFAPNIGVKLAALIKVYVICVMHFHRSKLCREAARLGAGSRLD